MMKPDVWDRILNLFHGIENQLTDELRKSSDLGISEFRTLHHLTQQPERETRMQELSEFLQLTQSSTTRLVERLEKRGFVYRDSCPSDGRGKYCVLTESGFDYIEAAIPNYERALQGVTEAAMEDPDARAAVRDFCGMAGR